MSDFWEKNKGSITSGLKTAGKYGYQGSKFVAKTGYQAGKKNFNSRKKNENAKKEKEEEEEEEEMERDPNNRNYGAHYGNPGQSLAYPQPYQQPQYPQPQYPQPQYPQPQYPQAYPQPQYPQQPYPQPQYPQQPYPQSYPQQSCPQPQPQYPQYQQPQPPQPLPQYPYQQAPQPQPQPQFQQPPPQPVPPQHPQRTATDGLPQAPVQNEQAHMPVPSQVAQAPVLSPIPQPPLRVQTDVSSLTSDSQHSAQNTVPAQAAPPANYSRARLGSPPLPSRAPHPLPESAANISPPTSVPSVTPFDYSDPQERREARRLPTTSVDLSALPPPPTHRDRGSTPDLAPGNRAPISLRSEENLSDDAETAQPESGFNKPQTIAHAPSPARRVPTPDVDVPPAAVKKDHEPESEVEKSSVAGRFDYDVKVNYAPPPKPHRNVAEKTSKGSSSRAPVLPPELSSASKEVPPQLPRRQMSSSTLKTNVSNESSFQPPPKPFRPTQSSQPGRTTSHSSLPTTTAPNSAPGPIDLSSFPPPPVQRRSSARSVLSKPASAEGDNGDSKPTPRGRIPVDATSDINQDTQLHDTTDVQSKKAGPPVVKPKPRNLSSKGPEHANASEVSAITNELSTFKLRKTGSGILNSGTETKKRSPPPAVPRKKDSLKQAPPVPMKSASLRARQEDNEDPNPFEHYLKSAVPTENDRLHR